MSTGTAIRVGADVVAVQQVAASVENLGTLPGARLHGARADPAGVHRQSGPPAWPHALPPRRRPSRFSGRAATSPIGDRWRSVGTPTGGAPSLLPGHAAALADQAGIGDPAVSLTHEGDVAAAVVVALCRADDTSNEQPGLSVDLDDFERDD